MQTSSPTLLGVLGSPIEHSKSPILHAAAYRRLGLDWAYGAHNIGEDALAGFLGTRGPGWRGVSLTMPLKSVVVPLCRTIDDMARRTGAVNTVVFAGPDADAPFDGFNTDVEGVRGALDAVGAGRRRVEVLGNGNTAASMVVALAERGATDLLLRVREPARAADVVRLARSLGLRTEVARLADPQRFQAVDVVANTIPGGTELRVAYPPDVRREATLLDAIYDPWPTALAQHWIDAGSRVVSGLDMLLHQAVGQIRRFVRPEDGARDATDAQLIETMRTALADAGS